jgi:hypothetical protein
MTLPNLEWLCQFDQDTGSAYVHTLLLQLGIKKMTFCGGVPQRRGKLLRASLPLTVPTGQAALLSAVPRLIKRVGNKEDLRWYAPQGSTQGQATFYRTAFLGPFCLQWSYIIQTDSVIGHIELAWEPLL